MQTMSLAEIDFPKLFYRLEGALMLSKLALIEKLRNIENLYLGATTPGEKQQLRQWIYSK